MAANIKFKRTSTSTLPTGLTFAEPAFVLGSSGTTTSNQLYIGDNSGGRVWVGAKIENTVTNWTGTEANTLLATQQAIDARITSRITSSGGFTFQGSAGTAQTITPGDTVTFAAGSGISTTGSATDTITIANTGVTGIQAGTAITVSSNTGNVTVTNNGVQSLTLTQGSGISLTGSGTTGALSYTVTNSGVTGIQAGTAISVSSAAGFPVITNIGVQSISGTANQITASGSTGAVTLSLPSAVTMPGSLTVTGNLTVNGTTTTVNSTTVTVQDPIISIGGLTGNIPPVSGDTKDRGIVAQYRNTSDTAGLTGFFGIDQSTGYFTYVPSATVTSEVISGTVGSANLNGVLSTSGTNLSLQGTNTSSATITVAGAATASASSVGIFAGSLEVSDISGGNGKISLADTAGNWFGTISEGTLSGNRTYTLPDHTGTFVIPSDLGTSGYILKANGTTSQPTWINPTASGFTAYVASNVNTTEQSTGTFYLTFTSAAGVAALSVDATATTALSYNVATGTLTAAAVDALIDGGSY